MDHSAGFNPAQPWSQSPLTLRQLKFGPNTSTSTHTITHTQHKAADERRGRVKRYLVEEVESFDVGLFSLEKLFGDVQELLSLWALRGADKRQGLRLRQQTRADKHLTPMHFWGLFILLDIWEIFKSLGISGFQNKKPAPWPWNFKQAPHHHLPPVN